MKLIKNVEQCVNGWVVRTVKEFETGKTFLKDTLENDIELSHVNAKKYLRQVVSSDSKNAKNILKY